MLTDEQIESIFLDNGWSFGERADMYIPAGRAIEAEARAQYTALIRQLVEAIKMDRIDWEDWPDDSRTAFEKIRARLLDSDLAKLTERGAKAWTGIDAQDLRDGGKP